MNLQGKFNQICLFLLLCLLFIACRGEIPSSDYMEGKWESEDGLTQIEFFSDGTCQGILDTQSPDFEFFFKTQNAIQFENERWKLYSPDKLRSFYTIRLSIERRSYEFNIKGSGLLWNKSPWTLFQFIGDPDQLEMYELHKVDKLSR